MDVSIANEIAKKVRESGSMTIDEAGVKKEDSGTFEICKGNRRRTK